MRSNVSSFGIVYFIFALNRFVFPDVWCELDNSSVYRVMRLNRLLIVLNWAGLWGTLKGVCVNLNSGFSIEDNQR